MASYRESKLNHYPVVCSGWCIPVCQLSHRAQEDNFDPTVVKKEKLNLPTERHKTQSLFVFEFNDEMLLSLLFPKHVINDSIIGFTSVSVGNIF